MKRLLILGAVFFGVWGGALFDAGAVERSPLRVKLMIQADKEMQAAVENHLRRELRKIENVSLVQEKADSEIRVIVMGSGGKEGEISGVAFSTVFLVPYLRSKISAFESRRCPGGGEEIKTNSKLADVQIYQDHLLQVGSAKDIEEICRDIAGNFKEIIGGPSLVSSPGK